MFGRVAGRSRWAALGAIGALLAGGGLLTASAASLPGASLFVPITPCRLLDTRPATKVGTRATPVGAGATFTATVWGTNGNCTIPSGATGVSLDVVAINGTSRSFLTVFPADKPLPVTSNLNWIVAQPPTPNAVTVSLSVDGKVSFFNHAGSVDLAVDIVGYYASASTALPGALPSNVVWVAKSGGNFTSVAAALASITDNDAAHPYVIKIAPGTYTEPGGIDMKDHVDLEGSGVDNTVITCACGGLGSPFSVGTSATLRITGPTMTTEVRDLTVANTGPSTYSAAIWNGGNTPFGEVSLLNVKMDASGGIGNYALVNDGSTMSVDHASAVSTGSGGSTEVFTISNVNAGQLFLRDVNTATNGAGTSRVAIHNADSNLEVNDSLLTGTDKSIDNSGASAIAFVANTLLSSAATGAGSSFHCVGDYNGIFAPLGTACV